MAEVWEDLDQDERSTLAKMVGADQGVLALSKVASVLRAVIYRYHDYDIHAARQWQADAQRAQTHAQQMADYKMKALQAQSNLLYPVGNPLTDPWLQQYKK